MEFRNLMLVVLITVSSASDTRSRHSRIYKRELNGNYGACEDVQRVSVDQGNLRGECGETSSRKRVCWFKGIPYARPPTGKLRFKDPEPPENYDEEYDATKEKCLCPQYNINYVNSSTTEIIGHEDCLYLNVYRLCMKYDPEILLPVMVWIYGGGHSWGSGNRQNFGPDYLVDEGLVVVTFNYRMGPLGFLYMEEAAPGNAGMKDQVAALRWIQNNIEAFGGDPDRVTLFGSGSGAADVELHQYSQMSEGLFSAVIHQGGAAVSKWAMQDNPLEYSSRLARAVGCEQSNKKEAVECMRGTDVNTLLEEVSAIANKDKSKIRVWPSDFAPTVDYHVEEVEPFLTEPIYELVTSGKGAYYPAITGINNMESMIYFSKYNFYDEKVQKEVESSFKEIVLSELILPIDNEKADEAVKSVKDFYMDGEKLCNATVHKFLNLLNNLLFRSVDYSLICRAMHTRMVNYAYLFTVDDALNFVKPRLPIQLPGACHDDNVGYLFAVDGLNVNALSTAAEIRQSLVKTWAEFATDRKIGSWEPYERESRLTNIIGDYHSARRVREGDNEFWDNFYDTYAPGIERCKF